MNTIPKWLIPWLGGLLIVFVALAVVQKAYEVTKNFQSDKPENTISISAEGKVTAEPDMAVVNVGVFSFGPNAATLQDDNSKKVNKVIDFIKSQGIKAEDITTSQFSIYPQYDYSSGKSVLNSYQASQTVTVKVKGKEKLGERVGKILDGATDNGANQITGVYFTVENPDDLKQEARKLAIANAKKKAQELADEAGIRLGKVVSITESGGYYPTPMYYDKAMSPEGGMGGGLATAPDIQVGSQDIVQNISVVFEVK